MSEKKDNISRGLKQNQDGSERRGFSLPPTSSNPPMPRVKPPKKK